VPDDLTEARKKTIQAENTSNIDTDVDGGSSDSVDRKLTRR